MFRKYYADVLLSLCKSLCALRKADKNEVNDAPSE